MKVNNNGRQKKIIWRESIPLVTMILPFLVLFVFCTVLPIAISLVLSFFDYDVVNSPIFIGIDNYTRMFTGDEIFPIALKNTLLFAVITGPISFVLSFLLAWMLNDFGRVPRSILSFLFYSPALVGNAYFVWQILFHGDSYGYVNSILISLNLISEPIQWFRTPTYAIVLVMAVQLWMGMGVAFLANLAGLQNVNAELYEASVIDGIQNRWAELWYITLPTMRSILLFGCVIKNLHDNKKSFLGVAPNAYAAMYSDCILAPPSHSGEWDCISEDVPFYQIVFKGSIPISSASLNLSANMRTVILRGILVGAAPAFTVYNTYDSRLRKEAGGVYMACDYSALSSVIIETANEAADFLSQVNGASVTGFSRDGEVTVTTFSNGITVYVNFSDTSVNTPIGSVESEHFIYGRVNEQ